MNDTLYIQIPSPIGPLLLDGTEHALQGVHMSPAGPGAGWRKAREPFAAAIEQLEQYFAGERMEFDLELDLRGTRFQRDVWNALLTIPYGETRSYGEIARQIGRPDRARAVGAANGSNPVSIIVPCHRVIGSDGSLTGYGGGLPRKRFLLDLEAGVGSLNLTA
ncbi:MAG TPA: methylated-DNA--[protein]-cysteine S-methyltransferase [Thermoleophilaceae bacterium]